MDCVAEFTADEYVIEGCSGVLESDVSAVWAYRNRGRAHARKGNWNSAITDHTAALVLEPANTGHKLNRAWAYFSKGDYESAIADYDDAIQAGEPSAPTYTARGLAREAMGDAGSALADFEAALDLEPGYSAAKAGALRARVAVPNCPGDRGRARGPVIICKDAK
jgi:tetratricopeptide (TPR) repeat protein